MEQKYRILIIDDDVDIINTIIDCLEGENPNYVFYHANNGVEGINAATKHKPDLIVTDWEMPGLSGIDTIKRMKEEEKTKDIPVIMLTGIMTSSKNLKTALEAGAIDFIRKPIDEIELTARIKSMLMLADYYKEIVDYKNRQLTTTAMNILQNNEFNVKTLELINEINLNFGTKNKKLERELNHLSQHITNKIKGEAWEHFKSYFQNVHPQFFKNITNSFPDLTATELKLAAFIRLNLSAKEIASIIFISPESAKKARTRLRKKINLTPDDNITTFLQKF